MNSESSATNCLRGTSYLVIWHSGHPGWCSSWFEVQYLAFGSYGILVLIPLFRCWRGRTAHEWRDYPQAPPYSSNSPTSCPAPTSSLCPPRRSYSNTTCFASAPTPSRPKKLRGHFVAAVSWRKCAGHSAWRTRLWGVGESLLGFCGQPCLLFLETSPFRNQLFWGSAQAATALELDRE